MLNKLEIKLFIAAFLLGLSAISVNAVTYTVTNTNDSGAGSLRDAVAAANGQTANDTINFNIPASDANCADGVCRITLTSSEILINATSATGKLTITNASGANRLIISGNNSSRIFYIQMGESEAVIDGVTIQSGGGFGATNPNVNGFGGGIYVKALSTVPALLTISNSAFNNNNGQFGGGIYCLESKLAIIKSAFISNGAQLDGGGIYNYGSTLNLVNSTIHSGTAGQTGAGIFNYTGTMTITNTTIASNRALSNTLPGGVSPSGGIANFGTLAATKTYIRNTIIANNTAIDAPRDIYHGATDTFVSNGNNLIGISNNTGTAVVWQPTDIRNQLPNLAPLDFNGATTPTQALLSNSPALNAGNNCVLTANGCGDGNAAITTDQRGLARQSGTAVDIGAYELQTGKTPFDFDGDGKSDVAVTRNNGGNLAWYLLNSQSGFSGINFGVGTDRLVPADYDGDGKTDVAVVRVNANNSLSWYIQQSRDGFTAQTFGSSGDTPVPADYDGDGRADVAVTRSANGALSWYINRSRDGFTALQFGATGDVPVVGDYDGDGKSDVAVFRSGNWYLQQSTAGYSAIAFGLGTDKPVPADYDGDGKTNVAVFRASNGTWYTSPNAANNYGAIQFGAAGDVPVPADYDGDGKTDVAVARANGGNLTWYLNRSQSGFTGIGFGVSADRAVENAYIP